MKLLFSPASPFVRKVRALLYETGHEDAVEIVRVKSGVTGPIDEILSASNPTGKIPTLLRNDGPAIYDSRVICRYLDHKLGLKAYPDSRLWEVLTLEATADAIMDAGVLMVYEGRYRAADNLDTGWVEGQWSKVARALDAVEQRWMSHLAGPADMSHLALGCALGYLDFRHGDRGWRDTRPALAEWYAEFAKRPSMVETEPSDAAP